MLGFIVRVVITVILANVIQYFIPDLTWENNPLAMIFMFMFLTFLVNIVADDLTNER